MKNFIEEFKAFAVRGNVVDLAVAVVIGTAFGKIVSSLVENIITPMIGVLIGGINFTKLAFVFGDAEIKYGTFLQNVFDFIIIAFAIFIAVKALKKLQNKEDLDKKEEPKEIPEDIALLREIRDSLKR